MYISVVDNDYSLKKLGELTCALVVEFFVDNRNTRPSVRQGERQSEDQSGALLSGGDER